MRAILSFLTEVRNWPRNVRLFFWANLLYQIGNGMFSVLYNLYIQGLGYPDAMNGHIISIQSLATAILFIPVGLLGDRFSRKKLLALGALFSGIFFVGRSFAMQNDTLLLLAVCSGIFAAIFQVMAIPFLAENVSRSQRLRMFSFYSSLVLAAQVIGNTGGGVLADALHASGFSYVTSLQFVLVVGSVATLLAFIPMIFVMEKPVPPESAKASAADSAAIPAIATNTAANNKASSDMKFISRFMLAQLLTGLGSGLVVPYLNLYFTNRFDVSLTSMSILISLGQLMTIVSMLLGPALAARIGTVRAVVAFQMLSLPFLLLTGFTNVLLVASISFLFRQALMNAANPLQSSIMVDRVSDKRRSIANSLMQTVFMLGWATMGPVQSYLVTGYGTYWGYAITFSITGVLYIASSLLYYFMFRQPPAHETVGHSK
ncbi:MFS transporter [Paenibacillus wulumuqiensis]|uniref:MFS transporter n=1 Tax=Paenibacillus wulumuqiensis TaxID=1567107 RepID=UPI0006196A3D|nr:MFS transporter [Paenibacillus wulumuqiensis]